MGTKYIYRRHQNVRGINGLDEACMEHDEVYVKHKYDKNRIRKADKILMKKAAYRLRSHESKFSEKLAAGLTWLTIGIKVGIQSIHLC